MGELSQIKVEQMAAKYLKQLEANTNIKLAQQKQKELYEQKRTNLKTYRVGGNKRKREKTDEKFVGPLPPQ